MRCFPSDFLSASSRDNPSNSPSDSPSCSPNGSPSDGQKKRKRRSRGGATSPKLTTSAAPALASETRTPLATVLAMPLAVAQVTAPEITQSCWQSHQSMATVCKKEGGHCSYEFCPGRLRPAKRQRSFKTIYRCVECSSEQGKTVWFCNTTKLEPDGTRVAVLCHLNFHAEISKQQDPPPAETLP